MTVLAAPMDVFLPAVLRARDDATAYGCKIACLGPVTCLSHQANSRPSGFLQDEQRSDGCTSLRRIPALTSHPGGGANASYIRENRAAFLSRLRERAPWLIAALCLMLFCTGNRLRETLKMEWSWIDEETGYLILPGAVTKNKRDHLVPLLPQARRLLDMLKPMAGDSPYVVPGPTNDAMNWEQKACGRVIDKPVSRTGAITTRAASFRRTWPRWASHPMPRT